MGRARDSDLHPARLPVGTEVGPWRVLGSSAQGTYGAVYRAVRVGEEGAKPVALKLALLPWDPRFQREAVLLDRIRHPNVPLLSDHGYWRHPSAAVYPCLVMEWVEGTPLYDWALEYSPTSRQMARLLAQLARVLQATHSASAVHRDVKGSNVLVRHSDSRPFLIDFGAGNYAGAERLTWQALPPGTNGYRAPEAWHFALRSLLDKEAHYTAGPADDVFALGVTAYRLVTGQYPPPTEPEADTARTWYPESVGPQPPLALNPQVDPRLSAVILRMLSVWPEARGTAEELAEALEHIAETPVPEAAPPPAEPLPSAGCQAATTQARARLRSWQRIMVLAASIALWVVGMTQTTDWLPEGSFVGCEDAGTVALGDSAQVEEDTPDAPPRPTGVRRDIPKKPLPGQQHAPCGKSEEAIRGGCWIKHGGAVPPCPYYAYEWEGACYLPFLQPPRPATSEQP
ncbi:serine/threonine protein kinase [Hyalangium rubrum]|uniref:Serine/threonine-protein kinase n=1 Tax=Hyalangium rubrum TaxID=3103134 RepID=A0ABU5GYN5_9BACT|nr:serine/threonine-protein kinase [Hyalangium sp. s54d21]MDY7226310.1 serine/threonine-protein kinase [Hyalangium sp. s54d21]